MYELQIKNIAFLKIIYVGWIYDLFEISVCMDIRPLCSMLTNLRQAGIFIVSYLL